MIKELDFSKSNYLNESVGTDNSINMISILLRWSNDSAKRETQNAFHVFT